MSSYTSEHWTESTDAGEPMWSRHDERTGRTYVVRRRFDLTREVYHFAWIVTEENGNKTIATGNGCATAEDAQAIADTATDL